MVSRMPGRHGAGSKRQICVRGNSEGDAARPISGKRHSPPGREVTAGVKVRDAATFLMGETTCR